KPLRESSGADLVADLLDTVHVRSAVFCRPEMRAPWGFGVAAHGNPSFHVVTRGRCWLEVEGASAQVPVSAADLEVLPHGPEHRMRDEPGSATPWLDDILADTPPGADGR